MKMNWDALQARLDREERALAALLRTKTNTVIVFPPTIGIKHEIQKTWGRDCGGWGLVASSPYTRRSLRLLVFAQHSVYPIRGEDTEELESMRGENAGMTPAKHPNTFAYIAEWLRVFKSKLVGDMSREDIAVAASALDTQFFTKVVTEVGPEQAEALRRGLLMALKK